MGEKRERQCEGDKKACCECMDKNCGSKSKSTKKTCMVDTCKEECPPKESGNKKEKKCQGDKKACCECMDTNCGSKSKSTKKTCMVDTCKEECPPKESGNKGNKKECNECVKGCSETFLETITSNCKNGDCKDVCASGKKASATNVSKLVLENRIMAKSEK